MDSQWKNTRNYFQMVGKKLENAQDVAIRFMWEREIIIVQEVIAVLLYGKITDFFESQGKILDEATVRKLLSEKQVHFKDLVSEKTKRKYEATIKMEVSETGNPKFQLIFPERKKGKRMKNKKI